MLNESRALKLYKKLYGQLDKTGYVKHNTVLRYLMYSFLLDFVEYTHFFFDEEEYNLVAAAMRKLFADGGCLLPYPVFCANRVTIGRNEYMGTMKIRKTEDVSGYKDRYTEDDYHRTV